MSGKMVILSRKDYKDFVCNLKGGRRWALISTRRALVDEMPNNPGKIEIGDMLIVCDGFSGAFETATAIERNHPSHDPAPAFIKCVPA